MADIRIDNEKTLDVIAGLAAAAHGRKPEDQITLLTSAGLLAGALRADIQQAADDERLAAAVVNQEVARDLAERVAAGVAKFQVSSGRPKNGPTYWQLVKPSDIAKRAAARVRKAPRRRPAKKIAAKRKR